MKYGLENINSKTVCANCGSEVSIYDDDFCRACGAPLSPNAIANFLDEIDKINQSLIEDLKSIAKENNTDKFSEIIEVYKNEI